jgi:hypothetical protein
MSNLETLLKLEDELGLQIGKKLRYQNLLHERFGSDKPTTEQRIAVAEEVLNGPWLGVLGAQAERTTFEKNKNEQ